LQAPQARRTAARTDGGCSALARRSRLLLSPSTGRRAAPAPPARRGGTDLAAAARERAGRAGRAGAGLGRLPSPPHFIVIFVQLS